MLANFDGENGETGPLEGCGNQSQPVGYLVKWTWKISMRSSVSNEKRITMLVDQFL
jgi:hypothetical protein